MFFRGDALAKETEQRINSYLPLNAESCHKAIRRRILLMYMGYEFSGSNLSDITLNKFSTLSKIAVKPNSATNMCIVDGFLTI